jgi:hypothetical protein
MSHESHSHPFLTASVSSAVTISIQGVATGNGAIVNYITPPANLPNSYGNNIYVWPTTGPTIPWLNKPISPATAVPTDNSTSVLPVNYPAQEKGYIIGYGVAPTPNGVCASVYIPSPTAAPTEYQYANTSITVPYVGLNLVQVQYTTLPTYDPGGNGNWIGMWQGTQVPYSGEPMAGGYLVVPSGSPSSGYLNLTGAVLLSGYSYVVGYFMVEKKTGRTSLAASTTFTVGQS